MTKPIEDIAVATDIQDLKTFLKEVRSRGMEILKVQRSIVSNGCDQVLVYGEGGASPYMGDFPKAIDPYMQGRYRFKRYWLATWNKKKKGYDLNSTLPKHIEDQLDF